MFVLEDARTRAVWIQPLKPQRCSCSIASSVEIMPWIVSHHHSTPRAACRCPASKAFCDDFAINLVICNKSYARLQAKVCMFLAYLCIFYMLNFDGDTVYKHTHTHITDIHVHHALYMHKLIQRCITYIKYIPFKGRWWFIRVSVSLSVAEKMHHAGQGCNNVVAPWGS